MDVETLRVDFPILNQTINGGPLAYLDNAATTQVPEPVLQAVMEQYHSVQANVHRGIHTLSERSTQRLEQVRAQVKRFLNAQSEQEIIFTSGATAALNLVARAMGFGQIMPGDEILVTQMEHHANLIPWQQVCKRTGALLRVAPVTETGELDMGAFASMLSERTRLAAVTCVSNVTGAINPVEQMIQMAHRVGAQVLLDGAQAMRHRRFDVQALDCDYLVFSGHKMMAPTGVGVLYGKKQLLEQLPPENFGGGMVQEVTDTSAVWDGLPFRLEAGTPNIAGIVGLGAALSYLEALGWDQIAQREQELLYLTVDLLTGIPGLRLLGDFRQRAGAVSFNLEGFSCFDTAKLLDQLGVAVRSGHHCAQPLLTAMGETGAVRVSPAFYNTEKELRQLADGLKRIRGLAGRMGRSR